MSGVHRLAGALAATLALAAPGVAAAQAPAPSITVDTSYAFSGVTAFDFAPGTGVSPDTAAGAAADPGLDRLYAVGTTADGAGTAIAVVARKASGALDDTFAGDGALSVPVTPAVSARGADLVVLPDHRLRIVGTVDDGAPGLPDLDVVVVGLLPDGSPDPAFGTAGVQTFAVGVPGTEDTGASIAVDAAGRLAITGSTGTGTGQNSFVAVREPDGSAAAFGAGGSVKFDQAAGAADRGADVAWGPDGPLALVALGTAAAPVGVAVRAFEATGADDTGYAGDGDLTLQTGGSASTAGGLVLAAGRVWVTGASRVGSDTDAYLARTGLDGGDEQVRRFDMRGSTFPATTQVASAGTALTLLPGDPDTLVVGGETATDRGTEVAAAAFNLLDGPLAGLQATDVVVPVEGQGTTTGVAAAGAGVALTAALRDFSLETGSGSNDTSIGMGRLVVDAEKRCDLRLTITGPLELRLRGRAAGLIAMQATNGGQRACGGTVAATPPFALGGEPVATGRIAPGATVPLLASVSYAPTAVLPERAELEVGLTAPADAAPGDNVARVGVRFASCDLRLRRFSGPASLPTEGRTVLGFSIRNRGTADCRTPGITVGTPGVRTDKPVAYTIPAGQSVTEEITVRLAKRTPAGRKLVLSYRVPAAGDVRPADNALQVRGVAVRPGDTSARTPTSDRVFSGRARAGRAPGVSRRTLRVRTVQIALLRRGRPGCQWLGAAAGRFTSVTPGARGRCDAPVWVTVKGTSRWSLRLGRRLAPGRYQLLSRAILRNGVTESAFSARDRNQRSFEVRARTSRKRRG